MKIENESQSGMKGEEIRRKWKQNRSLMSGSKLLTLFLSIKGVQKTAHYERFWMDPA
jgi:hypothetical protein